MDSKPVTPFQSSAYRPAPAFSQVPIAANAPSLPQKIDLNGADPMYHDIYNEYNSTLDNLNSRLANANQQAQAGQRVVQQGYDLAAGNAENAYTGNLDTIRSANADATLKNRLAARAGGAGSSSGYLDLNNRTDLQSQKDIAQAGRQLTGGYQEANMTAQKALAAIQASLGDIVAQIQQDGTLSLRQKNDQINNAKIRASQLASSNVDWGSILGGGSTQAQDGGNVLGLATDGLDVTVPNDRQGSGALTAAPRTGIKGFGFSGTLAGLDKGYAGSGGGGGYSAGF